MPYCNALCLRYSQNRLLSKLLARLWIAEIQRVCRCHGRVRKGRESGSFRFTGLVAVVKREAASTHMREIVALLRMWRDPSMVGSGDNGGSHCAFAEGCTVGDCPQLSGRVDRTRCRLHGRWEEGVSFYCGDGVGEERGGARSYGI